MNIVFEGSAIYSLTQAILKLMAQSLSSRIIWSTISLLPIFHNKITRPYRVNSWFHPSLSHLNASEHPPVERHISGAFSCIRERRHWYLGTPYHTGRQPALSNPNSCQFDLTQSCQVIFKSTLEIRGDVRIRGKKKQVALSLIGQPFTKMSMAAIIWLPDTFQEEFHKVSSTGPALLLDRVSRILSPWNYTPDPKSFIRRLPSGQSNPRTV